MLNFIRTNLRRMFKTKSLYVTLLLLPIIMVITGFVTKQLHSVPYSQIVESQSGSQGGFSVQLRLDDLGIQSEEDYESYIEKQKNSLTPDATVENFYSGTSASISLIFLGIFLSIFTTRDFTEGYIKNLLTIEGARYKWIVGNIAISTAYLALQAVAIYAGGFLSSVIVGAPLEYNLLYMAKVFGLQTVIGLGFAGIIVGVSLLTKKLTATLLTGLALGLNVQGQIYGIVDSLKVVPFKLSEYGLVNQSQMIFEDIGKSMFAVVGIAVAWLVVFTAIGYIRFKKSDIIC